ncbi:MAG: lysostaphin resistance A-like protein [Terriglobia bacterium]
MPPQDPIIPESPPAFPSFELPPPKHPEPWRFLDLILFLVFAAFALFASDFLALAFYSLLKPWAGWHASLQSVKSNPFFLLGLQAVFYVLVFGFIYALVVFHYQLPFRAGIRWRSAGGRRTGLFLLAGIFLAFAVQLIPSILPDKQNFPLLQIFTSPAADYAIAGFAIFIAPFMEELVFRGLFFEVFEARINLSFATVVTALLFAALHVSEYWGAWNHVLMIFVVGLVFSLARAATGSLVPSVMIHATYNATLMVLLFFQSQHFHEVHAMLSGLR